jgi:predicted membrane protein
MNNYKKKSGCLGSTILFGLLVIAAGFLMLAFNFNWIDSSIREIVFSWQMLFIVAAIVMLFNRKYLASLFWLILGLFFLLPKIATVYPDVLPWVDSDFVKNFMPVWIILIGLGIIFGTSIGKNKLCRWRKSHKNFNSNTVEGGADGVYTRNIIFGGYEDVFLEPVFRGGKIEIVFGGVELDLRKTTLPEGDTVLSLEIVFGGVELHLPNDWQVVPEIDAIFGGVETKRTHIVQVDDSRRLIITGEIVFGGCEIN